jgi:hypothetical protein
MTAGGLHLPHAAHARSRQPDAAATAADKSVSTRGALSSIVNQTEIRVVGMSRSGNHAIIEWMLAQATGRTCLLNCAEPGHNPYLWARPLSPREPGHRANFPLDIERERAGAFSRKDYLLHSYEDVFLGAFRKPEHVGARERWVGASRRRIDVLILRDPFNLFASRLAAGVSVLSPELAVHVWCQHARQFLGRRRYLDHPICINYNRWASSASYRRSVSQQLGLKFDDRSAHHVPSCAGGSSFDGLAYDGDASGMRVFDRWRRYAHDPDYLNLFTGEIRALAREIYGQLPTDADVLPRAA